MNAPLNVKGKRHPIEEPWYLDYEVILPRLWVKSWDQLPMEVKRNFSYHVYCYEELDDCVKSHDNFLISNRVEIPKDEFSIEVPHDMYEKAVNGEINGMAYAVQKLVEYLATQFGGNFAEFETYIIDTETGTYTLEV